MSRLFAAVADSYDFVDQASDPRVKDWPLLSSPLPILTFIFVYLYFVLDFGPKFMQNRKAYSLKTTIIVYNIFQVTTCIYLFYAILTSGWTDRYTLGCEPVDYSDDPKSLRLANIFWWVVLLKMTELVETVFFTLRKKYNQVSFLHLYHHVSTLLLCWIGAKFTPGGMASFPVMVNCIVHVLMYTYYLLAAIGPAWQKRVFKYKKYLTVIQMVQFCVLLVHSFQTLLPSCNVSRVLPFFYIPNVFVVFYLFHDFYNNAYSQKKVN